ncbi:MAG: DUF1667 domain-containing protein [Bacilli bacterium]|nr:DUF1667 domain-containing protein [Bacilli bacterium]MDY6430193.1 DUF1667 domain-containing protein [Bacilli bacterium]
MTELTCIICPRGCHLTVDDSLNVSGNFCPRGVQYAKTELTAPTRTLTSTVKCNSKILPVCPIKSVPAIPKGKIFECMKIVNETVVNVPIHIGDILIENIADTGCNIVATRDLLY